MAQQDHKQAGSSSTMRIVYTALAVVAVAGLALVGYRAIGDRMGGAVVEPVELTGVEDSRTLMAMASGMVLGDADAPITILEFGDYQCPACGSFASRVKPFLEMEYIEDGTAQLVFYDFPLVQTHEHAFLAARAARCASDQDAYWEYHDQLFGQQSEWAYQDRVVDDFVNYATSIGLDGGAFESCVNSGRYAEEVTAGRELATRLGVRSTPTVIINGRQVRNPMDFNQLRQVIETELGG